MIVKITQCPDRSRWYSSKVGENWEVFDLQNGEYSCRSSDGYLNFILASDCELVDPAPASYIDDLMQESHLLDMTEDIEIDAEVGGTREALGVPYMRFLPLEALAAAAASFEYGAKKYESRNWEKGLPWQQMIDSLKRHIDDFERGIDHDDAEDGSGLHQVCMIMASAMMLSASVIRGIGKDDRTPLISPTMTAKECARWIEDQLALADQHSNKSNK